MEKKKTTKTPTTEGVTIENATYRGVCEDNKIEKQKTLKDLSLLELDFFKKELVNIVKMYAPQRGYNTTPMELEMYNTYNAKLVKVEEEIKYRINQLIF
jgi:hypothetical protein